MGLWDTISNIGSGIWDFVSSPGGGAITGGLIGAGASALTGGKDDPYALPTGSSWNEGGSSSNNESASQSSQGSQSSSTGKSWSGTAGYMKPYTTGSQGIYPLAQQQYLDNIDQGYFGQTQGQEGINQSIGNLLQQYITNPNAVQGQMGQAGSFGDRYGSTLAGVDPAVQGSMNQFLGGAIDTQGLDALQQAATNRAMVGYGDAVQDAGNMFTQQIAPSIRSGAMLSGQYGGSRQGVAEGVSSGLLNQQLARNARDLGLGSMDVGSQLYSDAYQQARDNQYGMSQFGAGFGLEQNEQNMRNLVQNAGMEQQGLTMQDDAMARYLAGQQAAYDAEGRNVYDQRAEQDFGWQQLLNYMGAIQGEGQVSKSSSSSTGSSWGQSTSGSSGSSSGHTSGGSATGTAVGGEGYGLLEATGYGAGIGEDVGSYLQKE